MFHLGVVVTWAYRGGKRRNFEKPRSLWVGQGMEVQQERHIWAYVGGEMEGRQKSHPVLARARQEFRESRPTWAEQDRDLQQGHHRWAYVDWAMGVIRNNALGGRGQRGVSEATLDVGGARHRVSGSRPCMDIRRRAEGEH